MPDKRNRSLTRVQTERGELLIYRRYSKKTGARIYRFLVANWMPKRIKYRLKKQDERN